MKKTIWMALLITGLLLVTSAVALASDGEDYEYELASLGATITAYNGDGGDIIIPGTLDGNKVTAIGRFAFSECDTLTSVVIPDTVTDIEVCAFYLCENLKSVTIPNSVTAIGTDAFASAPIEAFIVSEDHPVYRLFDGVLYNIIEKTLHTYPGGKPGSSFTIPQGILAIGGDAFYDNKTLSSLTIPDTVTSIGALAFYGMTNLKSLYIPDSVDSIMADAFESSGIERFEVSTTNEWLDQVDGVLFNREDKSIMNYPPAKAGSSYQIPPGITRIASCAFDSAEYLVDLSIPDTVKSIGSYAFYKSNLETLDIPSSVTSIGSYAFARSTLRTIEIPSSITTIEEGMFHYCDPISITLPNTIVSIGDKAFYYCWDMKTLVIPEGVTSIGELCFYYCRDLTSLTIPASVTSIADDAFEYCDELTLWVVEGSYAQEYAQEHGIAYSIKPGWL